MTAFDRNGLARGWGAAGCSDAPGIKSKHLCCLLHRERRQWPADAGVGDRSAGCRVEHSEHLGHAGLYRLKSKNFGLRGRLEPNPTVLQLAKLAISMTCFSCPEVST